ncbi:hypothetical protein [Nonomuraea sp. NPDC049624]
MVGKLASSPIPVKVAYSHPVPTFSGHGACDADEWINAIVNGPNGDGDFHKGDLATPFCISNSTFCLSRESFHPRAAGTTGYATAVQNVVSAIGYKGS